MWKQNPKIQPDSMTEQDVESISAASHTDVSLTGNLPSSFRFYKWPWTEYKQTVKNRRSSRHYVCLNLTIKKRRKNEATT
jgi:hypothetical protein